MRVGVTGHQRLSDETAWRWVEGAMLHELEAVNEVIGISSLAIGADQLFANCVLNLGGALIVVVPFPDYAHKFPMLSDRSEYDRILAEAIEVVHLPGMADDESSYLEAGKRVVELSDLVFTVWDGKPAQSMGGTGDVVALALKSSKRVVQFEPYLQLVKEITRA
jgi:hypothetical protein